MGNYDFTTRPNRLNQHSYKWKETENTSDLLQMWVADMDFLPLPEIRESIISYGREHIFGYSYASDSLYQSIIDWERKEHGYHITKDDICFIDGVVPAISVALQAFTKKGDAVLINSPVYYPFSRTITLNERQLVENSLMIKNNRFEIDFEFLEEQIVSNGVKVYLFCSPHNPGGRVWTSDEVNRVAQICQKYNVLLISDEIHQDLTLFGNQHYSVNTLDDTYKDFTIILSSATKTFNIAGLKNSFALISNPDLRRSFQKQQLINNQHEIPTLGLLTTEAAFTYGKPWLTELKQVLENNITYVDKVLSEKTKIKVMKPQGTYLIWLDFSAYGISQPDLGEELKTRAKVVLNDGSQFGKEGKFFARLNIATPFETVKEAIDRLVSVFGD